MADNYLKRLVPEARPTPRNLLAGYAADLLGAANDYAQKPDNTMPMGKANPLLSLLAEFAGLPSLATTANRISYGEPLTNIGKANVPLLKPETADALMMAPLNPRAALGLASMGLGMADNGAAHAATVWHGAPIVDFGSPIKNQAEQFAKNIEQLGLTARVEHSGSAAGKSSYVEVYDPITGRSINLPARFSDHSKGPVQSQFVFNMSSDEDLTKYINAVKEMQKKGKSKGLEMIEQFNSSKEEKTKAYWKSVLDRANVKLKSGEPLSSREKKVIEWKKTDQNLEPLP